MISLILVNFGQTLKLNKRGRNLGEIFPQRPRTYKICSQYFPPRSISSGQPGCQGYDTSKPVLDLAATVGGGELWTQSFLHPPHHCTMIALCVSAQQLSSFPNTRQRMQNIKARSKFCRLYLIILSN